MASPKQENKDEPWPPSPGKASSAAPKQLLSQEDIAEFQEIFNLIDTDRGGSLSSAELHQLVENVGMKLSDKEFDDMLKEVDSDNSGEIEFNEFIAVMSQGLNTEYTINEVLRSFETFSRNAPKGLIRMKDLYEGLTVYLYKSGIEHHVIADLLAQFEDSTIYLPGVLDKDGLQVPFFKYNDYTNLLMASSQTPPDTATKWERARIAHYNMYNDKK